MTKKENPKPSSPDQFQDLHHQLDDEIYFIDILLKQKTIILSTTVVLTFLSILYAHLTRPTYKSSISFLKPPETFIPSELSLQIPLKKQVQAHKPGREEKLKDLNDKNYYTETSDSLYHKYLTRVQSYKHQRKVFEGEKFIERFGSDPNNLNVIDIALKLHKAIVLQSPKPVRPRFDTFEYKELFEKPVVMSIQGNNPEAISDYLNSIAKAARRDVRNETIESIRRRLNNDILYIQKKIKHGKVTHHLDEEGLLPLEIAETNLLAIDLSKLDPKVVVISKPSFPAGEPIKPKKIKIVSLGILVGILVGWILAYLAHEINTRRTREELDL